METFPNAHLLWSPAQLAARLRGENVVVLDLRPSHELMEGVIPGAAHFDLYGLGMTRSTPELFDAWIQLMRSLIGLRGVGMDRTVVLYESSQTGIRVGRAFWLLEYFGHEDVHVLDGGFAAWRDAAQPVAHEMSAPRASRLPLSPRPERFIDADGLNALLGRPDVCVLDTRSDDEHYGRNKRGGARGGTIPGAVHLEWLNYLDERGRMKPPGELAALFETHGVTRDKKIVPF